MGIKIADILNRKKDIKITLDNEYEINITFNPEFFTPDISAKIMNAKDNVEAENIQYEATCKAIIEWDLFGDDNKKAPITPETLRQFSYGFTNAIWAVLVKESRPNMMTPDSQKGI